MELISVVVPIYKVEKYINKCIDSIINQTYKNLEIILIDDGSPDNCGKICDEYAKKDNRIRVIHKKNEGVSIARNTGMSVAAGNLIMFVDSDDWLCENSIEILYDTQMKNNYDLVMGNCSIKGINDEIIPAIKDVCGDFSEYSKNEKVCEVFSIISCTTPWAKIYKKTIIDEYDLKFKSGIPLGEDTLFVLDYYNCASKISIISDIVYNYNLTNSNSAITKYYENFLDYNLMIIEKIKDINSKSATKDSLVKYISHSLICVLEHYLYRSPNTTATIKNIENMISRCFNDLYFDELSKYLNEKEIQALKDNKIKLFVKIWKRNNYKKYYKYKLKLFLLKYKKLRRLVNYERYHKRYSSRV